jgi:hypothetical protein
VDYDPRQEDRANRPEKDGSKLSVLLICDEYILAPGNEIPGP